MLAAVLGWVLPCQSTPILLHKRPKGRFGLHAIVDKSQEPLIFFLVLFRILTHIYPHIAPFTVKLFLFTFFIPTET